jgi:hypothetical protein
MCLQLLQNFGGFFLAFVIIYDSPKKHNAEKVFLIFQRFPRIIMVFEVSKRAQAENFFDLHILEF